MLDAIADADTLRDYAPLPAAWARRRSAFTAAAALTRNARESASLLARADACDGER